MTIQCTPNLSVSMPKGPLQNALDIEFSEPAGFVEPQRFLAKAVEEEIGVSDIAAPF